MTSGDEVTSGDDVVIIDQVINHQQTDADADDIGIINGQQRNDAAEKKKTEKNLNELTGREKQLLEELGRVDLPATRNGSNSSSRPWD